MEVGAESEFTFLGNDVVALSQARRSVLQTKDSERELTNAIFGEMSDGDADADCSDNDSTNGVVQRAVPLGKRMDSYASLVSNITTAGTRKKRASSVSSYASSSRTAVTDGKRARPRRQKSASGFDSDADANYSFEMESEQAYEQHAEYSYEDVRVRKIRRIMKLGPPVTWA
jgi:ADP-ribosylglycohydrolase